MMFRRAKENNMSKKIMVLGASAIALALSGCSDGSDTNDSAYMRVETIEVDGKPLDCVAFKQGYGGGVSCNWESYNDGN